MIVDGTAVEGMKVVGAIVDGITVGNVVDGKKSVMIRLRLHPSLTAFARSLSVYGAI